MTDSRSRDEWQERSKAWAATGPQGKSQDDSFNQMIIAEAAIKPGEDVLDIATGGGNPAVSTALSMNGHGSVTCTDLTPRMLETTRVRAENLSLAIMRFAAADMRALPFPDGTFDCITCRFGIMFPDDKIAAASEARRVLKPGGRIAYVVWGPYEENPAFYVPRRAVAAYFGDQKEPAPARHSMSPPGTLKTILDGAGYARTEERDLRYKNRVDDLDTYVSNGLKRSFAKKLDGMADAEIDALKRALLAAWEPFREDGVVQVPNYARLGLGWKES
jgi:SAM-dependent methyltransferase